MKILKDVKSSPFLKLERKYYFGKIKYGTPYFNPSGFNPTIISTRKLIPRNKEEYEKIIKDKPWLVEKERYKNLPMVRRSKEFIFKIFNSPFWLQIGKPIVYREVELGWKDKYNTPRFEWGPSKILFFFKWQFCIFYAPPKSVNADTYWEMFLWWKEYSKCDLELAESTWEWTSDGKSTWDNSIVFGKAQKRDKILKELLK